MSVETDIYDALVARVAALPGGHEIVYQNQFLGEPPETYIAVSVAPNRPIRLHISDTEHRHRGILQLGVMTPLNQAGVNGRPELAGQVAAHFPTDLVMVVGQTRVRVAEHPHVAQGYRDKNHWRTPVLVWYESLAAAH